jgi:hypothetical protein
VFGVGGAIDHGDHCLQPAGGLHLAPEEKLGTLFHEKKSGRCCHFLAVVKTEREREGGEREREGEQEEREMYR